MSVDFELLRSGVSEQRSGKGRPRIGLVMDHPRRDLPGTVLVALELVLAGATAVIVPAQMSWIEGTFADLDGIVINRARPSTIGVIEWLARLGQSVFVLDDEGYLSSERHAMLVAAIGELDAGRWLKGYFVWGEASGQALAEADPRLADRILATGAPRFDLLAPRWRGMLRHEPSGYVLLNPNFNSINPYHGNPKRVRTDMLRNGWDPAYLDHFFTDMGTAFTGFLQLCNDLPRCLPHRQFVLRPHPFELPDPYARAVAGLGNVRLNSEGDVAPVLANATHLVHVNCNTSVEARLLGLPPIQASFLNSDMLRDHMPLYSGVSIKAKDLDDLCRLLDDSVLLAARDDAAGIFERWIRPSFHSCDGYAARRVAEAVLAGCGQRVPQEHRTEALGLRTGRQAKLALCGGVGTAAVQWVRSKLHPDRSAKAFTTGQVGDLVSAFGRQLGMELQPVRRLRSPWTGLPMSSIQIG
jgi:surface carbohydrate biosynthesis protein